MMISLYRQQIFLMNAKAASHTIRELLGRQIEGYPTEVTGG